MIIKAKNNIFEIKVINLGKIKEKNVQKYTVKMSSYEETNCIQPSVAPKCHHSL